MADAFSYFLPDGTPVNAGAEAPPPGTPFYKSEALVPNANGALTSTAAGDASNAFRGFVSADGGGFGGFTGPREPSIQEQLDDPNSEITAPNDPNLAAKMRRGLIKTGVINEDGSFTQATLDRQNATEPAAPTPNKVRTVLNDPFTAFGADTLPPPQEPAILSPRVITNTPPPVEEGYRKFTGRTFSPDAGGGAAPPYSQAAWSGGEMAPSAGSATRPSLGAGRFGRFAPVGGASPFAQKYRQRFKPLGAPANGFTPQGGGVAGGAPTTQVF